jgi:hypothetical protein
MSSSSPILPHVRSKSSLATAKRKDEELRGLLAGVDASDDHDSSSLPTTSEPWPSKRMAIITVISLIMLIAGGIFALLFFYTTPKRAHPDLDFTGHALRSNGTHNFKRTVIIVSIDGLR